ncbi:uncharacterized protein RAG0_13995 [Rhynchosporium agropyri]|uniref:GEgh 16 protein n=1 Tax=Rhynchosporium agropyri TaxID=914238 RepID=A0A1E1LF24_9HELO|nr:uncharacterized protein RAG0_13995 [Rhynchosporium agropyri]
MFTNILIIALAPSPLVIAHGKGGDIDGNTTALGIMGGIVPGPGRNKVLDVDTTVFGLMNSMSDGLGKTAGGGKNRTKLAITQQIPGTNGNIRAPKDRRFFRRVLISADMVKHASNVKTDEQMADTVPAGTTCAGTVNGQQNVCLVKIANSNPAEPFGGVIAIQMASAGNTTLTAATADYAPTKASTAASAKAAARAASMNAVDTLIADEPDTKHSVAFRA